MAIQYTRKKESFNKENTVEYDVQQDIILPGSTVARPMRQEEQTATFTTELPEASPVEDQSEEKHEYKPRKKSRRERIVLVIILIILFIIMLLIGQLPKK